MPWTLQCMWKLQGLSFVGSSGRVWECFSLSCTLRMEDHITINISTKRCPLCRRKLTEEHITRYCEWIKDRGSTVSVNYRSYVILLKQRKPHNSVPICVQCWDNQEFCHSCNFPFLMDNALVTEVSSFRRSKIHEICEFCVPASEVGGCKLDDE